MSVLSDRDARSKLSDSNKGRCVDVFWVRSHFRSVLARKSNAGFPVVNPAYGDRTHLNPQLQSMGMVRSPKSIAGAVALALGNAPYQIGDYVQETVRYDRSLVNFSYNLLLN
ncbi:MAG: hypothetical protein EWV50_07485 [Microcystis aeruginosa Ma_MB_F_20061100_S20]|uniref:Uncharacterized protein n=1 Tax=Microcystis aeruginosa Ma_MB_F_20061100_S20D TaxID=2486253 RepID=A0A552EKI9_MICAE|nr:MAG: hypothetical protein EWV78_12150 [Microcystis aeruginosa Ma_MB_F_20061100_S20D]TRU40783.1 MAG: hypothetical protein EWV50_07485 [Microcystis aeruginosa Ma_MB_F_20061100_S20]